MWPELYFGACSGSSQAQGGGRSSIVLPELNHRNIELGYSESNDDSLNRPEVATTPPEPAEVHMLDVFMLPLAFSICMWMIRMCRYPSVCVCMCACVCVWYGCVHVVCVHVCICMCVLVSCVLTHTYVQSVQNPNLSDLLKLLF